MNGVGEVCKVRYAVFDFGIDASDEPVHYASLR